MKKLLIILLFILAFIITACKINPVQEPVCNKPYILVGTECCLDQNDNSICDKDEVKQEQPEQETISSSDGVVEVICPKLEFNATDTSEKTIEFKINYLGMGSTSYAPTLKCDDSYLETNLIRVILEEGQSQVVKVKIKPSYNECEFGLVETANINNVIKCKTEIKKL